MTICNIVFSGLSLFLNNTYYGQKILYTFQKNLKLIAGHFYFWSLNIQINYEAIFIS